MPGAIETDKYAFDPGSCRSGADRVLIGGPEGLPEIKLACHGDLSGNAERAEWVAGQYRDILNVELTLEPTDGTTLTALRKELETHPQLLLHGGRSRTMPTAELAQRLLDLNSWLDRIGTATKNSMS